MHTCTLLFTTGWFKVAQLPFKFTIDSKLFNLLELINFLAWHRRTGGTFSSKLKVVISLSLSQSLFLLWRGETAPFPLDFTKFQQIVFLQKILVLREKKIRNRPSCSNPYTRRVLPNFLKVVRATRTEVQRFKQHFLHKIIGTHNLPTAHLYFLPASKLLQLTWFWQEYTLQFLFLSTPLRLNIPFLTQFHPKQISMFVNTVSILDWKPTFTFIEVSLKNKNHIGPFLIHTQQDTFIHAIHGPAGSVWRHCRKAQARAKRLICYPQVTRFWTEAAGNMKRNWL